MKKMIQLTEEQRVFRKVILDKLVQECISPEEDQQWSTRLQDFLEGVAPSKSDSEEYQRRLSFISKLKKTACTTEICSACRSVSQIFSKPSVLCQNRHQTSIFKW
jgi:hypothetical protein